MDKPKVFRHIEQNFDRHLARLQELVRQPSISAENLGIKECAELVKSYLDEIGCQETKIVPTSGHPVVYGKYEAGMDKTVIIYLMYVLFGHY